MKTDWRDYLLIGLSIVSILTVTLSLLFALEGLVVGWLGSLYAPIVLAATFLYLYGLTSAVFLRVLQRLYPLRPGRYRLNHPQFRLWKLRHVVSELAKGALTPFYPVFIRQALYSLLGGRIGKNVAVAGVIVDPELTTLDDGCVIGEGAIVSSHVMARGRFVLAEVRVGAGATIGGGAGLMPGVRVGTGAVVLPFALVETDTEVGSGEVWGGLPARREKSRGEPASRQAGDTSTGQDRE